MRYYSIMAQKSKPPAKLSVRRIKSY